MKKLFIVLITFLALLGAANAACPISTQASTTQQLINEIPNLNSELQSCPIDLPGTAASLIGNNQVQAVILMNDGTNETFHLSVANKQITSISVGYAVSPKFTVTGSESDIDSALQSTDIPGAFLSLYFNGNIKLTTNSFFTRTFLFIANPFARFFFNPAPPAPANPPAAVIPQTYPKPANCDDTYMQGHRGYADNQALWDGYMADSDGICQSNNPVSCKYNVQLSVSGTPYYLCWYDN